MKKNLLVTLADKNYIKQAKQLFSSIYFNAGWKGDYMLLAYDIPEKRLGWFKKRGILIKKMNPKKYFKFKKKWIKIFSSDQKNISIDAQQNKVLDKYYTTSCKLFLFTPYFKQWKNIVYLDGDITINGSLEELTKVKGLAACPDYACPRLIDQFMSRYYITEGSEITTVVEYKETKRIKKRLKGYNTKKLAFNSGVIAFNTDIITDKTFSTIKKLLRLYGELSFKALYEQGFINLLFYKKWKPLAIVYNTYPYYFSDYCKTNPKKIKGIIFHYCITKPWNIKKEDYFSRKWKNNLKKADLIDLKHPKKSKKWTKWEIRKNSLYLKKEHSLFFYKDRFFTNMDRKIGQFGIFLKKKSPKVYYFLKKLKDKL